MLIRSTQNMPLFQNVLANLPTEVSQFRLSRLQPWEYIEDRDGFIVALPLNLEFLSNCPLAMVGAVAIQIITNRVYISSKEITSPQFSGKAKMFMEGVSNALKRGRGQTQVKSPSYHYEQGCNYVAYETARHQEEAENSSKHTEWSDNFRYQDYAKCPEELEALGNLVSLACEKRKVSQINTFSVSRHGLATCPSG